MNTELLEPVTNVVHWRRDPKTKTAHLFAWRRDPKTKTAHLFALNENHSVCGRHDGTGWDAVARHTSFLCWFCRVEEAKGGKS